MKQIKALPKYVFDNNFSNEIFKKHDNACFISIIDIDNTEQKYDLSIDNFLQVKMWDIENDIIQNDYFYEKPSDNELLKIVHFVNKNKNKNIFMIHCSAGISRSGAVAMFIRDKFFDEIDNVVFNIENKHILPNLYILKKLKELDNEIKK